MADNFAVVSTNGHQILIDPADLELVSQYSWTVTKDGYAKKYLEKSVDGKRMRRVVYMHRLILGAKENEIVDHINQDKLDNRRTNLRIASKSLNALNSSKTKSVTGFRGVGRNRQKGKPYVARITVNGRRIQLGSFNTAEAAHRAYLTKQKELIG